MTLDPRPASPGTNVPSRNRSAPLELFNPSTVAATTDRQPRYSPQRLVGPGASNGKTAADRPGTSRSARIVHAAEDGSVLGSLSTRGGASEREAPSSARKQCFSLRTASVEDRPAYRRARVGGSVRRRLL